MDGDVAVMRTFDCRGCGERCTTEKRRGPTPAFCTRKCYKRHHALRSGAAHNEAVLCSLFDGADVDELRRRHGRHGLTTAAWLIVALQLPSRPWPTSSYFGGHGGPLRLARREEETVTSVPVLTKRTRTTFLLLQHGGIETRDELDVALRALGFESEEPT